MEVTLKIFRYNPEKDKKPSHKTYKLDGLETDRVFLDRQVARAAPKVAPDAVGVFWVNPVADLRVMNVLEACGGRLCGTEFLFTHALDPLDERARHRLLSSAG